MNYKIFLMKFREDNDSSPYNQCLLLLSSVLHSAGVRRQLGILPSACQRASCTLPLLSFHQT
jgi:hypothetical protein